MSIGYKLSQEFSNEKFDYGDLEETIGFISDNYYEAMKIYRLIVKETEAADKIRTQAHEDLQTLRENETEWENTGVYPDDFDENEHAKTKDHLVEQREKEFDILYNGKPLVHDKLTHMIIHKMWLFKILSTIDMKGRKRLGPLVSKVLTKAMWPMAKMMEATAKHTDSLKAEKFLKKQLKQFNKLPKMLEKKIVNP